MMLEFINSDAERFIERFNRSYREVELDMVVFQSLAEVRQQTQQCSINLWFWNEVININQSRL